MDDVSGAKIQSWVQVFCPLAQSLKTLAKHNTRFV